MRKIITLAIVAALAVTGCKSSEEIEGFTYTEDGLGYMFHIKNDTGELAVYESVVNGHIRTRDMKGKVLMNTDDSTEGKAIMFMIVDLPDTADLFEGLSMMRKGDSATFIVNASTFYEENNDYPEGLKATDKIFVDVKLDEVIPPGMLEDEPMKYTPSELDSIRASMWEAEVKAMTAYFEKEGIKDYETLKTGVKIAITKKGKGAAIAEGDKVTADFVFYVLSNNAPVMSTVNAGEPYIFKSVGDVQYSEIPGLHDALKAMQEGDEAIVTIPFDRAFGERQMSDEIPPFSTLVGTIKIISVQKK